MHLQIVLCQKSLKKLDTLFSLLVGFVRCVKVGKCTSKCMQGYKQNLAWNDVKNQIKTKSKVVKSKRTTIDLTSTWSNIITRGA
jgi:hypothetical protein